MRALQATGLNRIAHKVYYRYFHGFEPASKGLPAAIERCFDAAVGFGTLQDGGDYLEFGLFKGYSFWFAQKAARDRQLDTVRFFGFDSFAGLPEVQGPDRTGRDDFYEGQYRCSQDEVVAHLNARGVDWTRTFLVPGFFDTSLTPDLVERHDLRRAAIALIDCDLYGSTVPVLRFLRPLVRDRTMLIFDDWNCFDGDDTRGQRRAFREFLASTPGVSAEPLFSYDHYGQVFVLHER